MNAPTRAEAWVTFAAAAMGVGDATENTAVAAKAADRMLLEFDKRFEWSDAYGWRDTIPVRGPVDPPRLPPDSER